ncbi:hypothetical protein K431DRAFT_275091 [Polychaeton citri CBS 116435]|uniref:Uncharacterized protein n=1 Tax=Polychaeton citri CBS 116435 TaxID=1314669 RepID=A0A9P4Q2F3_9PEZI|nr:hypothetical protein K431DRAFT_275091 [Polychaeton citri CBS 116435]
MAPTDSATKPLGNREANADNGTGDAIPDTQVANKSASDVKNTLGDATGTQKKKNSDDSSLKIRIELDLEVEVHLTARVKGDITIGLL